MKRGQFFIIQMSGTSAAVFISSSKKKTFDVVELRTNKRMFITKPVNHIVRWAFTRGDQAGSFNGLTNQIEEWALP